MGRGYKCTCKKCGYSFEAYLGEGLSSLEVYQTTVEAIKRGEYGEQGMQFYKEHPNGIIDCENVVVQCEDCGEYHQVLSLAMYTPKKEYDLARKELEGRWPVAFPFDETEYVSRMDRSLFYDLCEKYNHTCPECGGATEMVEDFEERLAKEKLCCAKCDGTLKITDEIWWD